MYIKEMQNKELKKKPICHPSTSIQEINLSSISQPDVLTVR